MSVSATATAIATAEAVRSGRSTALASVEAALGRIERDDAALNSCTRIFAERALRRAQAIDAQVARGEDPGPLAGVPFGAKDLFDIAGQPTTGGAAARRSAPAAARDAEAVRRLEAAGAVLVASCNMDEYAYGFATINAHHGTTRNPHDTARLAGGSSGGSAAAVAGGLFPLSLGSDTNGSVRVPAALCGLYGLKPTHGTLPMAGVLPFVDSFDDVGPLAATLADCALAWAVLRGEPPPPAAPGRLRIGRLGGFFAEDCDADLAAGLDAIAADLGGVETVALPEVARARSAAFLMTAAEGGARHLGALRADPMGFDPQTRDRLIAGAMLPAGTIAQAQRFRAWFLARVLGVFERFDLLIAPAAPVVAPTIADPTMRLGGESVPARAHLGLFTQPLSFVGLPALAVPLRRPGALPLGVQLVAAPGRDHLCFALAERLEAAGLIGASPPGAGAAGGRA